MKPNIGISDQNRAAVVQILNNLLADEFVLYAKTRNFHWNVTGLNFQELHKFFEGQYEQIDESIDAIAERARTLGGVAFGSLAEFLKAARLKEVAGADAPKGTQMLSILLEDHEALIRQLRVDLAAAGETHQDAGTSDFLTGILEEHEKMAWMIRSYLDVK